MKPLISMILFVTSFSVFAHTHQCQVYTVIQRYDAATMAFKSASEARSSWFAVTAEPHETEKEINIEDKNEIVGSAKVWTGTLLNTSEGDLIQAHSTFTVKGANGSASLIMSLDSSLAKSAVVLEATTESELFLIPVDLKCIKAPMN